MRKKIINWLIVWQPTLRAEHPNWHGWEPKGFFTFFLRTQRCSLNFIMIYEDFYWIFLNLAEKDHNHSFRWCLNIFLDCFFLFYVGDLSIIIFIRIKSWLLAAVTSNVGFYVNDLWMYIALVWLALALFYVLD